MSQQSEIGRMEQLDGLRAFAVVAVVFQHTAGGGGLSLPVPIGSHAVRLFFVLSGFLITLILLRARIKAESEGVSQAVVIKAFYARRALRIFPLYYLVLAVVLVVGVRDVVNTWWWHVAYLSNFFSAFKIESIGQHCSR